MLSNQERSRYDQLIAQRNRFLQETNIWLSSAQGMAGTVAILLPGSGSTRKYVQRLGHILCKGSGSKQAILYEVVAEETTEEAISSRRR